jgi:hypothetical protein
MEQNQIKGWFEESIPIFMQTIDLRGFRGLHDFLDFAFYYGRIDILDIAKDRGWEPNDVFIGYNMNVTEFDYDVFLSINWLVNNKYINTDNIPEIFKMQKIN